jgi:hydrogenase nickel incorporation protein HypA/HybF
MHELSVCQGLLDQVAGIARQNQATGVKLIRLQIGPLSGVEPQLLEQAFPLASAGTIAEHAALAIETLAVRVRCETCGAETEAAANRLLCGVCSDWHTTLISGDELLLVSVELSKNAAASDMESRIAQM